jgi:Fatty acid hydroxylase superfamily
MHGHALHSSDIKTPRAAWSVFSRKTAPRMIAVAIVLAVALRVVLGGYGWRDAVGFAAMLVVYPFGEWAIHVYLLHSKLDLRSTRSHREHHEEPHRLDLVNFGPAEALAILLGAAPLVIGAVAGLTALVSGSVPFGPLVTMLVTAYVFIGIYEWIHFLIHTAYKPRSRYYRAIWRNHRLHHFKNEHYWHGITSTITDTVLGTNPDQKTVKRSPTARALHG